MIALTMNRHYKHRRLWVINVREGLILDADLQPLANGRGWELGVEHGIGAKGCHVNLRNPGCVLTRRSAHVGWLQGRRHPSCLLPLGCPPLLKL